MDIQQFKDAVFPYFFNEKTNVFADQWVVRSCEAYLTFIQCTLSRPSATLRIFYNFDGSWEVRIIRVDNPIVVIDGMPSLQKCLEGIVGG